MMVKAIKPYKILPDGRHVYEYKGDWEILCREVSSNVRTSIWKCGWYEPVAYDYKYVEVDFNGHIPPSVKMGMDPKFAPDREEEWI